jgi:hypothetical protein
VRDGAGNDPEFPDQVSAKGSCVSEHRWQFYPISKTL